MRSALSTSSDHRPGAQGNRVGTGHSPAWHGAGAAAASAGSNGQANASALNGIKTQEFGGTGYNQLVFDDSNGQLRVRTTGPQGSGILSSMADANCLIEIVPDQPGIAIGERVWIHPLQGRLA